MPLGTVKGRVRLALERLRMLVTRRGGDELMPAEPYDPDHEQAFARMQRDLPRVAPRPDLFDEIAASLPEPRAMRRRLPGPRARAGASAGPRSPFPPASRSPRSSPRS